MPRSPKEQKVDRKQCPKCKKGWYMIVLIDIDGRTKYVCPICNHTINNKNIDSSL